MTESIVRFRDFSTSPEPVTFRIAPDDFECLPDIALDVIVELASLRGAVGETVEMKERIEQIHAFFDYIMVPDSAAKFRERTAVPTEEKPNPRPVGMRTVTDLMQWLMEVYGLRPTQPSSESADGSSDDEESSTDGVSLTVSMS